MRSFHNNHALKTLLYDECCLYREGGHYITDAYFRYDEVHEGITHARGNSIGICIHIINLHLDRCGNHTDHQFLADQLGLPLFITHLQDVIYAGLPDYSRPEWTETLLAAIPVGADLHLVLPRFLLRLATYQGPDIPAITAAAELLKRWANTGTVDPDEAEGIKAHAVEQMEIFRQRAMRAVQNNDQLLWRAALAAQGSAEFATMLVQIAQDADAAQDDNRSSYHRRAAMNTCAAAAAMSFGLTSTYSWAKISEALIDSIREAA